MKNRDKRVKTLGLDKSGRALENAGLAPEDNAELKAARLETLRGFVWSSYRAYTGAVIGPRWLSCDTLLSRTASDQPFRAYREYVEARLNVYDPDAEEVFSTAPVVGSPEFQTRARGGLAGVGASAANMRAWKRLLPFSAVVKGVEEIKGEGWDVFVNRHGDWGRDLALYTGRHHCGMTLRELGDVVGATPQTMGQCIARFKQKLAKDPGLRGVYERIQQSLQTVN